MDARLPHPQGENLKKIKLERNEAVVVANGALQIDGDNLFKDVRSVQQRTKCTNQTVLQFIKTFEKHIGCKIASNLRSCDKRMQVTRDKNLFA